MDKEKATTAGSGKELSRRAFLKGSTALGAAALLTGLAGCGGGEGGSKESEKPQETPAAEVKWDYEADVIVAGSGGGLVAACKAADAGASVILIEKAAFLGGECMMNEGWINGAGTKIQAAEGVTDSPETFAADWAINHADRVGWEDTGIVDLYLHQSGAAIDYLCELGCEYKLAQDCQFYGSAARAHILQPNAGAWPTVLEKAATDRGVTIMKQTPLNAVIVNENGEAIGVESGDLRLKAKKGVILATGDTSANQRLKLKFQPVNAAVSACAANNTGDGYFAALKVGADSSHIQNTGPGPSQMFAPEGSAMNSYFIGKGMILVNAQGKRYCNEMDYSGAARLQLEQPEQKAFGIFDARTAAILHRPDCPVKDILGHFFAGECCPVGLISGIGPAYLEDCMTSGCVVSANTLEELADQLGIDKTGLLAQVERWNAAVAAGSDPEFGVPFGMAFQFGDTVGIEEGPFYALVFSTRPQWFCADGPNLVVDTDMHILDVSGAPIPRLYGAGAGLCAGTGTIYTNTCGDHMGFTAVSAIISGKNAAAETAWA